MSSLSKFSSISRRILQKTTTIEHYINLRADPCQAIPSVSRTALSRTEHEGQKIDGMLNADIVKPALLRRASPVMSASMKHGNLRFWVDHRKLNATTVLDYCPSPRVRNCIDSLEDGTIFFKFDCISGYSQI